ncbi:helix-turn-helix domain-containing protein [Streptomyces sp. NPDC003016]
MKQGSLPDPAVVSSVVELATAAKALVAALGLKQKQVAQRSGLSEGTISGLFNGRSWPREETFESFITKGCDLPWRPWHEAWARAGSERRRVSSSDLSAEVEELRVRVESLETAIEDLSASVGALVRPEATPMAPTEWGQQARRRKGAEFLAAVGPAELSIKSGLSAHVVHVHEVDAFLEKVRELALQDMSELSSFVLTHTGSFSPVVADEHWDTGYYEADVAHYVSRLRREVIRYLGVASVARTPAPNPTPPDDPWATEATESALPPQAESQSPGGWSPTNGARGGYSDEPPF